jgi:hypothetical protein
MRRIPCHASRRGHGGQAWATWDAWNTIDKGSGKGSANSVQGCPDASRRSGGPSGLGPGLPFGRPGSHQRDGCLIWGLEGTFARQPARWSIPRPGLQSGHPHGVRPPSSGRNSIEQTCSVGSQCRPWHSWLQSTECRQVQSTAGLVAIAISPLAVSRALAPGRRHSPRAAAIVFLSADIGDRKGTRAGVPARMRRASQPTSGGMLAVSPCS